MSNVIRTDKVQHKSDRAPMCLESKVHFFQYYSCQCEGGIIYITIGTEILACPSVGGVISV